MKEGDKKSILCNLKRIPGVGDRIAQDLFEVGYRSIEELKDQDPQNIYLNLCRHQGAQVDRCMLYVLRCAVYFASHEDHDPELLKWWSWKDAKVRERSDAGDDS